MITSWKDLLRPGEAGDYFSRRPFKPFDPSSDELSRTNALWLAELSRLAYLRDKEEVEKPPSPTRTEILESVDLWQRAFFQSVETNTQAMLIERREEPRYAALTFRGTERRLKDFVTDLRVGTDALVGDDVAVHEGFRTALDSVWNEIETALDELECPVFYCGHSLGGALATLAAARRKPTALYTFGSPRVGNTQFVETLEDVPSFRVVDDWDLVALLPPEALGFRHVGELVTVLEPRAGFSFNPLMWIRLMFSPAKPLADHAPVNYVDRL